MEAKNRQTVADLEAGVAAGSTQNRLELAEFLRDGMIGVHEKFNMSFQLIEEGRKAGCTECEIRYWTYFVGDKDKAAAKEAIDHLMSEAHKGHIIAMAHVGSYLIFNDLGSFSVGYEMLQKAADAKVPHAMHHLAIFLVNQERNVGSILKGLQMLKEVAEMGYPPSMAEYGSILSDEEGMLQDKLGGRQWLEKAKSVGNRRAIRFLADLSSKM
jgi:TPR repeat protein